MLNRQHEKPEYFIAGYWVVDWKGVANYEHIHNIINFNYKSWILFQDRFEQQEQYPAFKQGYFVYQIMLGAKNEAKMQRIYEFIKPLITVANWYLPDKKLIKKMRGTYPTSDDYFARIEPYLRYKAAHNEKVKAGQLLKFEREPKYFLVGYWIIDWKGVFNYDMVKQFVQYEWNCWIWFWRQCENDYPKVQAGYVVEKVFIASDKLEDLEKIRGGLERFISIQDWHLATEDELKLIQSDTELFYSLGRIDWNVVGFGSYPDIPTTNRAHAKYNEDLAAGKNPRRPSWE